MAHPSVITAVTSRLETYWNRSPIFAPNVEGDAPEDGSPFVKLQFPASDKARPILNRRFYREEGGVRIVIAVEIGEGIAKASAWAEELATLFRDRKFSGVQTFVPGDIYVGDENDSGNYFITALVVPYAFNFAG
ncbi:phage tail terminator-like protein [Methylopila sp. M107]|uniref:phage tail terminator-like protein n=1 Tax=Methylopila sp. M107 TaxID=1101190 RepID=UPI00037FF0B0|nr:phage tail terminator-like protein [Methylopila sp. M107]